MAFKMTCPKCGTTDYAIQRDRRIRVNNDPTAGLIFSCRCGKQLFGSQVEEEFKRQRKSWEAATGETVKTRTRRSSKPASSKRATASKSSKQASAKADANVALCAWGPCEKPSRDGSKYCSRACSNKNARWRYKQRKQAEKEAA